jgi:hypothetical protein
MEQARRVAVLGAGPVGLEAALYAARLGLDVNVYERGRIADHVRRWGHVRMFSPWRMNRSPLGRREIALGRGRDAQPDDDDHPTGSELVERYLVPLAHGPALRGRVHERCRVLQVGRERIGKRHLPGGPRERFPFRLLIEDPGGERIARADLVLDCTGTFANPDWMGSGNIPALGERELRERIDYRLRDVLGCERERFAGRSVLLVGAGHSAATALDGLLRLPGTSVAWIARGEAAAPYDELPDDPLPERRRLARQANELARGVDPRVVFHPATVVERVVTAGNGFGVTLGGGSSETRRVDRILAHVGFSPDDSLYRELQVHACYATLGPMSLAAALLGSDPGDCLAAAPAGPDRLRNPEPGFFILGAKSYGKRSSFLIRAGIEQVRDAFRLVEQRPGLDLYAA